MSETVEITLKVDSKVLEFLLATSAAEVKPKTKPKRALGKYEGCFVFVENADPEGSRYDNGEYICIRETPMTLYCIKAVVGYGGHDTKTFSLKGKNPYTIVDSYRDFARAREFAEELLVWGRDTPKAERQWIGHVYDSARCNAEALLRLLENAPEEDA